MTMLERPNGQLVPARRQRRKRATISPFADKAQELVPLVEGYYMDRDRTAVYAWEEGEENPQAGDRKPGRYVQIPLPGGAPIVEGSIYMTPDRGQRASERTVYPVRLAGRPEQGVIDVTEAELLSGDAWAHWGGIPAARPRDRHLLANLVLAQRDAFQLHVAEAVDRTGWHQDPGSGCWFYLLRDGRALEDPAHPIPAAPPLWGYQMQREHARAWAADMAQLPTSAPSEEDVMLRLFCAYQEIAPHGHLFITAGAALRGLVCSLVPQETSLVAEGDPESGKTISQKHGRAVDGPSPYQSEADANFEGTATRIEAAIAPLADVFCIIDNFRMALDATPADARQVTGSLDRVILGSYSGEEMRGRGRRDGTAQQGRTVHNLAGMNGERIPGTLLQSSLRRVMLLRYEKDPITGAALDINIAEMVRQMPDMNQTLTRLGHTVLRKLVQELNTDAPGMLERIRAQEAVYADLLLKEAQNSSACHAVALYNSVPRGWARALTGWWLAEWALGLRPEISGYGPFVQETLPHVKRHMLDQLLRMAGVQRGDDGLTPFAHLALRLAERIRDNERINGQTWRLLDLEAAKNGGTSASDREKPPAVAGTTSDTWGWHGLEGDYSPVCCGYVKPPKLSADGSTILEDGVVYLLPKALEYLRNMAAKQQEYGSLRTDQGLWQAAQAEGWIVRRGDGKNRGVSLGRSNKLGRGWALSLSRWLGDDPDQDNDSNDSEHNDSASSEEAEGRYTL